MPEATLLAIDTAGEQAALALAHGGALQTRVGAPGSTRLEDVLPMIEALFASRGLAPRDCDAFAFACGPGSFTGLRVACTLVQGLALGSGRPLVAVSHFDALLRAAVEADAPRSAGTRALVLLDARMDEAYWGEFEFGAAGWRACGAPAVGGRAQLLAHIEARPPSYCVGDAQWIRRYIGGNAVPVRDAGVDPGVLARIAGERFAAGAAIEAQRARPLYVRDRVARTVAERRADGK